MGLDLSYPITKLLIDDATHQAWWDPALGDAQILKSHCRRVDELAVANLPYGVLRMYLLDLFQNNSHSNGFVANYLSCTFTLVELGGMNLWQQIDAKIAAVGGAAAMYKLNAKVDLERAT